jgi:cell division protein FtsB
MFFQKVKYKLSGIFNKIRFHEVDFKSILVNVFYFALIIYMGSYILMTFNKGVDDSKRFQSEEARLEQLKKEQEILQKEVEQYGSIEYKKIYARENLNLAEKKETLYYVERENRILEIERLPEDMMQISLEDNAYWWKKLILGL